MVFKWTAHISHQSDRCDTNHRIIDSCRRARGCAPTPTMECWATQHNADYWLTPIPHRYWIFRLICPQLSPACLDRHGWGIAVKWSPLFLSYMNSLCHQSYYYWSILTIHNTYVINHLDNIVASDLERDRKFNNVFAEDCIARK